MAFVHASGFEARALKVPVHVASEDAVAVSHRRCQVPQDAESGMGGCSPIELESLPVEAPCLLWPRTECLRRSYIVEPDPIMFQRWIYPPEAIRTAKIRQPGSTPMPAPAVMMSAPASRIHCAASLIFASSTTYLLAHLLTYRGIALRSRLMASNSVCHCSSCRCCSSCGKSSKPSANEGFASS